jgi:LPXTG-motif cell wall-anchored protein
MFFPPAREVNQTPVHKRTAWAGSMGYNSGTMDTNTLIIILLLVLLLGGGGFFYRGRRRS